MKTDVSVEVAPDKQGGWVVTVIVPYGDNRILTYRRRRRQALLVGTGAAMALECEFRPKNTRGEYTTEAATFTGHDPRRSKG